MFYREKEGVYWTIIYAGRYLHCRPRLIPTWQIY